MNYNIKDAREAKGMSREMLAAKCGVTVTTIINWEEGKHKPKSLILKAIKDMLK